MLRVTSRQNNNLGLEITPLLSKEGWIAGAKRMRDGVVQIDSTTPHSSRNFGTRSPSYSRRGVIALHHFHTLVNIIIKPNQTILQVYPSMFDKPCDIALAKLFQAQFAPILSNP